MHAIDAMVSRNWLTSTRLGTGEDARDQFHGLAALLVPAVSVVAVFHRERGHAGRGAWGGHRRVALLGRGLELAHAPRSLRLRVPKDLNACCPAGPETP